MGNCCVHSMESCHANGETITPHSHDVCRGIINAALCSNGSRISPPCEKIPQAAYGMTALLLENSRVNSFRQVRLSPLYDTQHIAEREPENEEYDPSVNVHVDAMFMKEYTHQSWSADFIHRRMLQKRRRCNSTSSIFIGNSTVSKPDIVETIHAVAIAICMHIRAEKNGDTDELEIFNEFIHPTSIGPSQDENQSSIPNFRTIHRFIRKIFDVAQLSPECAIVALVYLERLLHGGKLSLTLKNWKRILLCSIILASKVWDDQAVWNVDYSQIFIKLQVEDVNELERQFLEIIQFNINVASSVYTKYYFDIRGLTFGVNKFTQLSLNKARDLEACSNNLTDSLEDLPDPKKHRPPRRANSLNFYNRRHDRLLIIP